MKAYLSARRSYGHDDLAFTISITSDVAGKGVDVVDEHAFPVTLGRGTTYPPPDPDRLAGDFAHEWSEDQLRGWVGGV